MHRVLICGDRNYIDSNCIYKTLVVITGMCKGADIIAYDWAKENNVQILEFPADWSNGRSGGPIRNQRMLDEGKPTLVIGFHDNLEKSKGTKDMLNRSKKAKIPTLLYLNGQS